MGQVRQACQAGLAGLAVTKVRRVRQVRYVRQGQAGQMGQACQRGLAGQAGQTGQAGQIIKKFCSLLGNPWRFWSYGLHWSHMSSGHLGQALFEDCTKIMIFVKLFNFFNCLNMTFLFLYTFS